METACLLLDTTLVLLHAVAAGAVLQPATPYVLALNVTDCPRKYIWMQSMTIIPKKDKMSPMDILQAIIFRHLRANRRFLVHLMGKAREALFKVAA